MTVVYCDFVNGNDSTGNGSAGNPWKTIDKASTGLTGGDEVRVAKSPDPTALTGTVGFANGSTAVTGSGTSFTSQLAIGDFIEGGDGHWYEVVTIGSNTSATLYRSYPGTTQSGITSRKLGVTDTGAASSGTTQVQVVSSAGVSGSPLMISGGWDLSTQTQTGFTWFRQMHGTFATRNGYGLYAVAKFFLQIEKLGFLRYAYGVYWTSVSKGIFDNVTANSNGTSGIHLNNSDNDNTFGNVTANSNGTYGVYLISSNKNTFDNVTANSNGTYGVYLISSSNNVFGNMTANGNFGYGAYLSSSSNSNTFGNVRANSNAGKGIALLAGCGNNTFSAVTANNSNGVSLSGGVVTTIGIADINSTPPVDLSGIGTTAYINSLNGGGAQIWTDGGNIIQQAATAGGSGTEWSFNVTSADRIANYPLSMPVAQFAVGASAQVTVTLYFKKTHASAIAGRLLCRGYQIAGVDNDVATNCPSDTSRNQVQIQFTPSAAGVVEIVAEAWYVSSTSASVIIDDIEITQA